MSTVPSNTIAAGPVPAASDAAPSKAPKAATEGINAANQRAAANLTQQSYGIKSNGKPFQSTYNGKTAYITAPKSVARLFGTPLSLKAGPEYVRSLGDQPVRLVTSGWGDDRTSFRGSRRHAGLDFPGKTGEPIIASASGTVSFIGVQMPGTANRIVLYDVTVNPQTGEVTGLLPSGKARSFNKEELGEGGVYVEVTHDGDFKGYVTQSMHMSETVKGMRVNQKVSEGDVIGFLGSSGGYYGICDAPHLHWQVRYGTVIVKAEPLVPHYRRDGKQSPDAPGSDSVAATLAILAKNGTLARGEAAIAQANVDSVRAIQRAQNMQAQTRRDHFDRAASSAQTAANTSSNSAATGAAAAAKYAYQPPIVRNAMVYNFLTGLWSDDSPL